jgi:hypothetical protein
VKLFVVLLGGSHPKAKIEVHDIAFAIAECLDDARSQLLAQWFGARKGVHIDAWMKVDGVDGFKIAFEDRPAPRGAPRLYFVHLGGYEASRFGEEHGYELVVATSAAQAKIKSKERRPASWDKPHTDALKDIDACVAIDDIDGRFIHLSPGTHAPVIFDNVYKVLG